LIVVSGTRNIRLDVAYDGSLFRGSARSEGVRTVQGDIERALTRILQEPIETFIAGRTDKGVHASAQVLSFTTHSHRVDIDRLARSITAMCGPDLAVIKAAFVPGDFHARFSARARRYQYRILNRPVHDPIRGDRVWHVRDRLDVDVMNEAAAHLVGGHDFSSMCRRPKDQPDAILVRRVRSAVCVRADDEIHFLVEANAFCQQMVRSMAGLVVGAGRGTIAPGDVPHILQAKDRSLAPGQAPPGGLTLIEVSY
jgi:tRNA pseudouridine38-40 synthase